eukprot:TRINITY_DN6433_c0_g1_i1.p1 TRINITY_DN6433_c0_g1~~TRINITY_DN6433_c0_g1_i1.p1  ORF type:complete len:630 (-),score=84.67 TRINITY_DN6433_c0_g1_i1:303-2192(-)
MVSEGRLRNLINVEMEELRHSVIESMQLMFKEHGAFVESLFCRQRGRDEHTCGSALRMGRMVDLQEATPGSDYGFTRMFAPLDGKSPELEVRPIISDVIKLPSANAPTLLDSNIDRRSTMQTMARSASSSTISARSSPADGTHQAKDRETIQKKRKQKVKGAFQFDTGGDLLDNKPLYDVRNFYKKTGFFQKVARSEAFSNVTLFVIAVNALYMGVDANSNDAETLLESHWPWQVCENVFCVFFTGELLVRFLAFERRCNCLRDGWFKFDTFLVFCMVVETWVMTLVILSTGVNTKSVPTAPLRLLRMLRLSRLVRLMRSMPELLTLIKGIRVGLRAVLSSLILVFILIYMFGMVLHMFLKEVDSVQEHFANLPLCMWTLLMDGVLTDSTKETLDKLIEAEEWLMLLLFLFFVLLSCMTVMNMLIGVLCEVVSAVKKIEENDLATKMVKGSVLVLLRKLDADGSGSISKDEMGETLEEEDAVECLKDLNVDIPRLLNLLDMHFQERDELPMEFLMELIFSNRGHEPVLRSDLYDMDDFSRWDLKESIGAHVSDLSLKLEAVDCALRGLCQRLGAPLRNLAEEHYYDSGVAQAFESAGRSRKILPPVNGASANGLRAADAPTLPFEVPLP